jgi:putative heme-binding domain-containing protein
MISRSLISLILAAGALAAQTTVDLKTVAVISQGNTLFAQNCATGYCHGSEGRAARGPDMRNRDWDAQGLYNSIHGGIPGTTMPPWNNILPNEDIWALTAYIISLGPGNLASSVVTVGGAAAGPEALSGQAKRGHDLFFDLNNQKRCAICHKLGGKGTAVGPDLSAAATAKKSSDELMTDILRPGASIAEGFAQTAVTSGVVTVAGVKKAETRERIQIYDAEAVPPPLRTFYKDQIDRMETRQASSMPANYDSVYTRDELEAIVAYLKSGNL